MSAQSLLSMSEVEAEEIHFTVGQALVEAASGLLPRFKDAPLGFGRADADDPTEADADMSTSGDAEALPTILNATLVTKLASHKTAVRGANELRAMAVCLTRCMCARVARQQERTAAGVWLLSIVHRLGSHAEVQVRVCARGWLVRSVRLTCWLATCACV